MSKTPEQLEFPFYVEQVADRITVTTQNGQKAEFTKAELLAERLQKSSAS